MEVGVTRPRRRSPLRAEGDVIKIILGETGLIVIAAATPKVRNLLDNPQFSTPAIKGGNIRPTCASPDAYYESVDRLRNWASGRCLSASQPGIYSRGGDVSGPTARRVARASSN